MERAVVKERRHACARVPHRLRVHVGHNEAGARSGVACVCQDVAPRVDNERVAVGGALPRVHAALRGGEDIATGFDGTGAEQGVPVGLAGDAGEGCGHG